MKLFSDSMYMKYPERSESIETESRRVVSGEARRGSGAGIILGVEMFGT